jgi:hypothetical protein
LLVLLLGLFFSLAQPAYAQDPGPGGDGGVSGELDTTVDTVVLFMRDITLSVLRFGLFLSGLIFLVTVVWGSARSSLATAIGNHMQASAGLVTAMMAIGTLVLVLVAVPLTNVISRALMDQFLTPESLRMDVAGLINGANGDGSAGPVDPGTIMQIPELQTTIEDLAFSAIRFALGLGAIATIAATFLGAFDTQLGGLFGGGMLASRGILRIVAALGQLIILVISLPIAKMILGVLVPRLVNLTIELPF